MIRNTRNDALKGLSDIDLAKHGQDTVRAALSGWAVDDRGLRARFLASAFGALGLTRRSANYRRRQRKVLGQELPYVSPKKHPNKFRNLIKIPGVGHKIFATRTGNSGVGYLKASAARGLNFSKNGGTYLAEWSRLAPIEDHAILQRLEAELATRIDKGLHHHG